MNNKGWKELWASPTDRWTAIVSLAIGVIVAAFASKYLNYIEQRPGVTIADPIQMFATPVDVTWPIFFLLYGSLILAITWLWEKPRILFQAFRAYAILLSLRMICMWLIPLEPPPHMITLSDPIIELVAHSSGAALTRDLFFSGHTSVVFLAAFVIPEAKKRWVLIGIGVIIGTLLVIQHVHYTIDVVVAPMAALLAVAMSGRSE